MSISYARWRPKFSPHEDTRQVYTLVCNCWYVLHQELVILTSGQTGRSIGKVRQDV